MTPSPNQTTPTSLQLSTATNIITTIRATPYTWFTLDTPTLTNLMSATPITQTSITVQLLTAYIDRADHKNIHIRNYHGPWEVAYL